MDANGSPSTSVAEFGKVLDFIAIMNYDLWGPWSPTVGPNAPLDDACAASNNQVGSATSAVKKWVKAGIPSNQLVLGVPGYGHSFRVRKANAFKPGSSMALAPYPKFDASAPPVGDSWDDPAGIDVCGVQQSQGGVVNYWGLIENGYLNRDGSVRAGIAHVLDTCSQTVRLHIPPTSNSADFSLSLTSITQPRRSWYPMTMRRYDIVGSFVIDSLIFYAFSPSPRREISSKRTP